MYGNVGLTKKMEAEPWYSPYQHEKKWYEKVKSPKSGEYYQAEELIKRESWYQQNGSRPMLIQRVSL
jgi:hypothetical protein